MIKKIGYVGVFTLFLSLVISCEKDFQDVNTNLISNNKFIVKDTVLDIIVKNREVKSVRGDALEIRNRLLGQYLLGVLNIPNYEKIEASIVTQLSYPSDFNIKQVSGITTEQTFKYILDSSFVKLPLQVTIINNEVQADSVFGNKNEAISINVFELKTFLNTLDPTVPTRQAEYPSNFNYSKGQLISYPSFEYKLDLLDTVVKIKRKKIENTSTDTITRTKYFSSSTSTIPLPNIKIPLKGNFVKTNILDKVVSNEFKNQEAFNNFLRGIFIEAKSENGALFSLNFNSGFIDLKPTIEIFYTVEIKNQDGTFEDSQFRKLEIQLSATNLISNSFYNVEDKTYPDNGNIILQGTGGNEATIKLLTDNQILDLRKKNWIINDASLQMFINKDIVGSDTINTAKRLYLSKELTNSIFKSSQISDVFVEGIDVFGGKLSLDENNNPNKYTFRLTNYISSIVKGESDYNPNLILNVANETDFALSTTDTIIRNYSWNPKVTTLKDGNLSNGIRRAQLKISYSERK